MKRAHKLLALLLALVTALALSIPASAEGDTYSITIDNPVKGNTYTVYKVFSMTEDGKNYTLCDEKTTLPSTGFVKDSNGFIYHGSESNGTISVNTSTTLTADEISAIGTYVTNDDAVRSVIASDNNIQDNKLTISLDTAGYYYITTTTGAAVTVNTANPTAEVSDKNEAPTIEKKIDSADTDADYSNLDTEGKEALAQIGAKVPYTVTIDVKNGAQNYVFHDVMSSGLTYNDDIKVTVDRTVIQAGTDTYTYTKTLAPNDTITLTFNNTWIANQVGKHIVITYSATINSNALTVDAGKNTATLDYGDNQTTNSTTPETPVVYTAQIQVTKQDSEGDALAGAGFVLAKTVTEGGTNKTVYYKLENNVVSWVDTIDVATELKTVVIDGKAEVVFTGLADGTYTLIENTVPTGYNKADDKTITIAKNTDANNLKQEITVTNLNGSTLPTTGGMGTTIFYIVGGILVLGAVVLLVTKKRMNGEK